MKVRLLVSRVGNNSYQNPGDVIEVPANEAAEMIRRELAEAVNDGPEMAMVGGFQTATQTMGRPRKVVKQ